MNLDELKAELVGDWNSFSRSDTTNALTLIGPRLLDDLRKAIETVEEEEIPGHIVETGVWRGGACIWAAAVLQELGSDRLVYACDSFQGLPLVSHPKDTISFDDAISLHVSLAEVRQNAERFGILERIRFVPGWFKDTMPGLDIPVSILRLDGDMYESTRDVLNHMYDRVSRGGFVIIDDYQLPPCKLAVDEFRSRKRLRGSLRVAPGVSWRKP